MEKHWTHYLPEVGHEVTAVGDDIAAATQEIIALQHRLIALENEAMRYALKNWSDAEIATAKAHATADAMKGGE
jgi:hypothetical protein